MIHFINEGGNSELKHRVFPLSKGIKKHLMDTLRNYNGDKTIEGYKRLNNLLSMSNGISYNEMKRLKNFFDNYQGTDKSVEFLLNGGEPMKLWVNNTLYTATKAVHDFKQAKKDAGVSNAFIKSHEKNRQSKKNNKPTQVKFKTNNVNKNISNNELLKFENVLHENYDSYYDALLASLFVNGGTKALTQVSNGMKESKIINITENQYKLIKNKLNEAADNQFSTEELSNLRTFKERYNYCVEHLGKPQGKGSSRVCFQIDDEKILKLAWNSKGVAQNSNENDYYLDSIGIVPHIYDSDDNGLWVISEFVLPARQRDFKECLGLTFYDFVKFIRSSYVWRFSKSKSGYYNGYIYSLDEYNDMCENEDLQSFDEYIGNYEPPLGDLTRLCNYGMTMRNGSPTIVLLDAGLSQETWDNYYDKRRK